MIALITEDHADRIWRELEPGTKHPDARARTALAAAIGRRPIEGSDPPVYRLMAGGLVENSIRRAAERAGVELLMEPVHAG